MSSAPVRIQLLGGPCDGHRVGSQSDLAPGTPVVARRPDGRHVLYLALGDCKAKYEKDFQSAAGQGEGGPPCVLE